MNILQHISPKLYGDVLVTLNPPVPPAPDKTQQIIAYRHPLYTTESVAAQIQLDSIQGVCGIWFAGAWTGYGFHEDGFSSGIRAGIACGGRVPFEPVDARRIRGVERDTWRVLVAKIVIMGVVFGLLGVQLGVKVFRWVVLEALLGMVKRGREKVSSMRSF
jgi:hypothetical protein